MYKTWVGGYYVSLLRKWAQQQKQCGQCKQSKRMSHQSKYNMPGCFGYKCVYLYKYDTVSTL